MGIISALLTGGALIGKICQALSGGAKQVMDDEYGVMISASDLTISGVNFYQSTANAEGQLHSYAFNTNNDVNVSLVFPNDEAGNGLAYDVPPTLKQDIHADLAASHAPGKELLIGPSRDANTLGAKGNEPVMKLSFNNMKVGGEPVTISDYDISCDTSGMTVDSGSRPISAMTYLNLDANTGVSVTNLNRVESQNNGNCTRYHFPVDLTKCGLKKGDMLKGQLYASMASNALSAFPSATAEPLHPAEERYFRSLGMIK